MGTVLITVALVSGLAPVVEASLAGALVSDGPTIHPARRDQAAPGTKPARRDQRAKDGESC